MQNLSDSSQDAPLVIFKHLYPAVLQSFAIILLGYSSSRWRLILSSQCQGLAKYISHFALPALLFQKMATLKFGTVDWLFWLSILIGKGMVFVLVFVVAVAVGMPRCPGTAGIFAIFATQTNDFALGYPICEFDYFCPTFFVCGCICANIAWNNTISSTFFKRQLLFILRNRYCDTLMLCQSCRSQIIREPYEVVNNIRNLKK